MSEIPEQCGGRHRNLRADLQLRPLYLHVCPVLWLSWRFTCPLRVSDCCVFCNGQQGRHAGISGQACGEMTFELKIDID